MKTLEQNILLAQHRLDFIQQCLSDSSKPPKEIATEAISDLSIALEELHVATEELKQKNDQLLATRHALEFERQRYQDLFQLAPDGYLVTDTDGKIQEANYAIATKLGVRCNHLVGKPIIVFISKADRKAFYSQLNLVVQKETVQDWKINLEPRQAQPFPAEISIANQIRC